MPSPRTFAVDQQSPRQDPTPFPPARGAEGRPTPEMTATPADSLSCNTRTLRTGFRRARATDDEKVGPRATAARPNFRQVCNLLARRWNRAGALGLGASGLSGLRERLLKCSERPHSESGVSDDDSSGRGRVLGAVERSLLVFARSLARSQAELRRESLSTTRPPSL